MGGVGKSVRRKDASSHDSPSQRFSGFRDIKGRQAAEDRESLLYLRGIPGRGFVNDDLGDAVLKLAPAIRPPIPVWSVGAPRQLRHHWDERPGS
jgi:hypothetical protein